MWSPFVTLSLLGGKSSSSSVRGSLKRAEEKKKIDNDVSENDVGKSSEIMLSPSEIFVRWLSPVFCILGVSHQTYFLDCYHLDLVHIY